MCCLVIRDASVVGSGCDFYIQRLHISRFV